MNFSENKWNGGESFNYKEQDHWRVVSIYLDQLTRAEYLKSIDKASGDVEIIKMAEEWMEDVGY